MKQPIARQRFNHLDARLNVHGLQQFVQVNDQISFVVFDVHGLFALTVWTGYQPVNFTKHVFTPIARPGIRQHNEAVSAAAPTGVVIVM